MPEPPSPQPPPATVGSSPGPRDRGIERTVEAWRPGAPIEAPITLAQGRVLPAWIDANGHMSLAAYADALAEAGRHWLEYLNLGYANVARTGRSSFALNWHMTLRRELHEGARIAFRCQLLERNRKLFHYMITLHNETEGYLAATSEHLDLHVDMATRRSAPMPAELEAHLAAIMDAHRSLPWPEQAGQGIGIRKSAKRTGRACAPPREKTQEQGGDDEQTA